MQTAAGQAVAQRLRRRIVKGRWTPGTRLPARQELAREVNTCLATLQEAVALLAAEGFLRVGPRKHGTFVAELPPHLCHYKLVFAQSPAQRNQFGLALEAAAEKRTCAEQQFSAFYGLGGHRDIASYQAVVEEVRDARVAGLIFASSAGELRGTPLLEQAGLPRVAVAADYELPGVPKVMVDLPNFFTRAVTHLHQQGRRRIAVLFADHALGLVPFYHAAMAACGLPVNPLWEQFASLQHPHGAQQVLHLLLHPGQAERPDALILADDHFLAGALAGVMASGMRVPDELAVVALTNFPNVLPAPLPVTRLGFDVPALLDLLVERIEQVRADEPAPEHSVVPAQFEHELTA